MSERCFYRQRQLIAAIRPASVHIAMFCDHGRACVLPCGGRARLHPGADVAVHDGIRACAAVWSAVPHGVCPSLSAAPARQGPQACAGAPPGYGADQGVGSETAAPKISELPNLAGQSAWGAGLVTDVPVRSDSRHASRAGQSAALRTSFHTPTAPARVAAVYT